MNDGLIDPVLPRQHDRHVVVQIGIIRLIAQSYGQLFLRPRPISPNS